MLHVCRRYRLLEQSHAPYLEVMPFKVIVSFTLLQLGCLLGVYGITWAGIAGVAFPIPIMALVPLRQYVLPRLFKQQHLAVLDNLVTEEVEPIAHEDAVRVRGCVLVVPPPPSFPTPSFPCMCIVICWASPAIFQYSTAKHPCMHAG